MIAIVLFYNIATGPQACLAFSKEFKHCNVITYDGYDWICVDIDGQGLTTRVVQIKSIDIFLKVINKTIPSLTCSISLEINQKKRISWKPWWVRTCNEVTRYAAGFDVGLTFNPSHLYKKLLKYNNETNYTILTHWRR